MLSCRVYCVTVGQPKGPSQGNPARVTRTPGTVEYLRRADVADYKLLGKNYTTPDLVAKVTGQAKYAEDFRAEGMVFAKLLLSPMPHSSHPKHRRQARHWQWKASKGF